MLRVTMNSSLIFIPYIIKFLCVSILRIISNLTANKHLVCFTSYHPKLVSLALPFVIALLQPW